jgi:hypothetical protein
VLSCVVSGRRAMVTAFSINSLDWGSRVRGYHSVVPRPLRYGPFAHRLYFRPSSPEAFLVKLHEIPLLVKDGIGREMAGQFGLQFRLPCKSQGSFTRRKWDRRFYIASEGMLWIFFARKIQRFRPGSTPRSWVPEASMLTTRPPKPLPLTAYEMSK